MKIVRCFVSTFAKWEERDMIFFKATHVKVGAEVELVSDACLSNRFAVLADPAVSDDMKHNLNLCLATLFTATPTKSLPSKKI